MSLRIDSPDAAVAATPFLIGFPPEDSVVLLLLDEHDSLQVSMRVDLPAGGDLAWLQSILRGIPEPVPWSVLILAYADAADPEFAQAAGMWVMHALLPVMEIVDLVLVAHGRYSSLSRGDAEAGEQRLQVVGHVRAYDFDANALTSSQPLTGVTVPFLIDPSVCCGEHIPG